MMQRVLAYFRQHRSIGILALVVLVFLAAAGWYWRDFLSEGLGNHTFDAIENRTAESVVFAVIGDYGDGSKYAGRVSRLVNSWNPDFVATVGDNNYLKRPGDAVDLDAHIGRFYSRYIYNYKGKYGQGSPVGRFFPAPGHGDWDIGNLEPYLDYFDLPGNERYYDFTWGPVHIFMLDTDEREPDGATMDSLQAMWLKKGLANATSPWKLVLGQHAPYTSHRVADIVRMRWPFAAWGADAAIFGHYHVYERLEVDGIPYFVNGVGGTWISRFGKTDPHSRFRYRRGYGALAVAADQNTLTFGFINTWGRVVDTYRVSKDAS